MQMLKEGSQGSDVLSLQRKLAEKGFSPGALDGNFGPGTEAAVMAFQQGEGLLADGVVGAKTAAALGFSEAELPPSPGMPIELLSSRCWISPPSRIVSPERTLIVLLSRR